MTIGSTIKDLRKKKNFTQIKFAEYCEISQTYLSQIENNLKEPNISILKTIAQKLNIPLPIVFFLSLEEEDIPEGKREAYTLLFPSVKSLLSTFFSDDKNH
jgi:transcriptional regulator with XRE-family HTH domain